MRTISPIAFAAAEAERRIHKRALALAINRRKQKEVDAWSAEMHTVMELVGGEPTGLITEMLGSSMLEKNANSLAIYLQQMGNWNSFGKDPKPLLRELVTPSKLKNISYREKQKNDNNRTKPRY
jgi:hypothetical protein